MDDNQLLRYSRQILLPQIGVNGQQQLLQSRVLIIGLGGLGSPAAMYLAASGVGHLVLVDHDHVELSNLQRQIIHSTNSLGTAKVDSARQALHALNPEIKISTFNQKLNTETLTEQVRHADAVVDATDNFAIRFALNRICVPEKTAIISGAAIRMEGQVAVFHNGQPGSPCYRCLYEETDELGEACSETGILAPVAGVIGSILAIETIKVLLHIGTSLAGRLLLFDAHTMEWRSVTLRKDPACPVCSQ